MHALSRRTTLGASAAVASLLVLDGATGPLARTTGLATSAPAIPQLPRNLPPIVRSHFAESIGKTFTATADKAAHQLKLVAIDGAEELSFLLVFKPHTGRLPDAIYHLELPGVPSHDLMLSSLGSGRLLQAVVDRSH